MPVKFGARPQLMRAGGGGAALGQIGDAGLGGLVFTLDAGELVADVATGLAHGGVAGQVLLQAGEGVQPDGERHDEDHHPADLADPGGMAAQGRGPLGELTAGNRHDQQRDGHPETEGDREEHRGPPDGVLGSGHGDGAEDRPGAWHEDQAESQTDYEPAGLAIWLPYRDPGERTLEQGRQGWKEEAHSDHDQQRDAGVAQERLGQAQGGNDLRTGQDHDAEADHQPSDHRDRPGLWSPPRPRRWRRVGVVGSRCSQRRDPAVGGGARGGRSGNANGCARRCPASTVAGPFLRRRRPGHENYGKNREDTRRDPAGNPCDEANDDEFDHRFLLDSTPDTAPRRGTRAFDLAYATVVVVGVNLAAPDIPLGTNPLTFTGPRLATGYLDYCVLCEDRASPTETTGACRRRGPPAGPSGVRQRPRGRPESRPSSSRAALRGRSRSSGPPRRR